MKERKKRGEEKSNKYSQTKCVHEHVCKGVGGGGEGVIHWQRLHLAMSVFFPLRDSRVAAPITGELGLIFISRNNCTRFSGALIELPADML